jgi:hypothetical protein
VRAATTERRERKRAAREKFSAKNIRDVIRTLIGERTREKFLSALSACGLFNKIDRKHQEEQVEIKSCSFILCCFLVWWVNLDGLGFECFEMELFFCILNIYFDFFDNFFINFQNFFSIFLIFLNIFKFLIIFLKIKPRIKI